MKHCTCQPEHIFTAFKGQVTKAEFIKETLQGFRVRGGRQPYDHVVWKARVFTGWVLDAEKVFFTERSFINESDARHFATQQILSMQQHYESKLSYLKGLKASLGVQEQEK